jgi:ATPase subunit of ABC transporter with duplicated ATPase domains
VDGWRAGARGLLEDTLAAYSGALLRVKHDDTLARRVTTTRWAIARGRIDVMPESSGDTVLRPPLGFER